MKVVRFERSEGKPAGERALFDATAPLLAPFAKAPGFAFLGSSPRRQPRLRRGFGARLHEFDDGGLWASAGVNVSTRRCVVRGCDVEVRTYA